MDTTTVVVEAGDTMWALAKSLDADADPRVVVDAIVELNELRSAADIHPGNVLVVPRWLGPSRVAPGSPTPRGRPRRAMTCDDEIG